MTQGGGAVEPDPQAHRDDHGTDLGSISRKSLLCWAGSGRRQRWCGCWVVDVDDVAQRYRLSLVGVCCGGVQDAGHGVPQILQVGDLEVDGVQVGLQHRDDLGAGRRLAPAQADDGADFGEAEPKVAGLADEPQQLDLVLGVAAVAGGGPLRGRQRASYRRTALAVTPARLAAWPTVRTSDGMSASCGEGLDLARRATF